MMSTTPSRKDTIRMIPIQLLYEFIQDFSGMDHRDYYVIHLGGMKTEISAYMIWRDESNPEKPFRIRDGLGIVHSMSESTDVILTVNIEAIDRQIAMLQRFKSMIANA